MLNLMPYFLMFLISMLHLNRKLFEQIISHMTKAVRKAIEEICLENKYYKNKLPETGIVYKKQKLIKKEKKKYFSNLNMNNYTDNKKFWNKVKPLFSNYGGGSQKITLIEDGEIISNDQEVAETFNNFYINSVKSLK